ncbi:MAG TPA: LPXTG cell wall anchor domain-containing protein [Actinomycetota bacterium]|nr:LPXTG cell wall anchor domain-containing protein [Actinomycetota bacterium]
MRSSRMSRALTGVAVIATTVLLRASAAVAQSYPGGGNKPPTNVKGKTFFSGGGNPNPADTGTNVLLMLLLALLAIAIGVWLHRRSRRRADGREG